MKSVFFSLLILLSISQPPNRTAIVAELKPCPFSPNCVSSQEKSIFKRMKPIRYEISSDSASARLDKILKGFANAVLVEKKKNYRHYEFTTTIGNFVDDVEFLIDVNHKVIHFRSASRQGFGDFGKNRRRMKNIKKQWDAVGQTAIE